MNSFYSNKELEDIGLGEVGNNVFISRNTQIYSAENIKIGNNVRIDDFCLLSGDIVLRNNIHISAYSALYGKGGIEISDYCGCSPRSIIFSATDDFSGEYLISPMVPDNMTNVTRGKVLLDEFVQLGANTIVMPGVHMRKGSATAAFSFVNKDLDEFVIYAGIPCRKLKDRKKDLLLWKKMNEEK